MPQYILQAHKNEIDADIFGGIIDSPNHTGYDLITIHDDGSKTIQSWDLGQSSGKTSILYREGTAETYQVDGKEVIWNNELKSEHVNDYDSVQEYLTTKNAGTATLIEGTEAQEIFNKIKLDAIMRNSTEQLPGGLLDYDPSGANCNSWSNYIDQKYILTSEAYTTSNDQERIFDKLEGHFFGNESDLNSGWSPDSNAKSQLIEKVIDLLSASDLGLNIAGVNSNQILWTKKGGDIAVSVYDGNNIFVIASNGALYYDAEQNAIKGIAEQSFNLAEYYDYTKMLNHTLHGIHGVTGTLLDDTLTSDLIASLKTSFDNAEEAQSPLIMDLDGDGVETTLLSNSNIYFDHDGNGFAEKTAWAGADDGILVHDLNGNGQIDNGGELFGNNTLLSDGTKATNGFEALKNLDNNNDGRFDSTDAAFNTVKVWQDSNGNGIVDMGELKTLNQAGITSIDLNYTSNITVDTNGNEHRQNGAFIGTDGVEYNLSDVWFKTDGADTVDLTQVDIPTDVLDLPNVGGFGNVHDLRTAMALDETSALKTLVEQYIATTDYTARQTILLDLIYTWAGVIDVDPASRAHPEQGNRIGDARKLEALEAFLGQDFWGKTCPNHEDGPNPHLKAVPFLLAAFEQLKGYVDYQLTYAMDIQNFNETVRLSWNTQTNKFDADVSQTTDWVEQFSKINPNAHASFFAIADMLKLYGTIGTDIIAQLQNAGENEKSFNGFLLILGDRIKLKGDKENNTLSGTDDNNIIFGLDGNDKLSGGTGNDILYGGAGNDGLEAGHGEDYLDGGVGNDGLSGGAGDDTYRFGFGYGQDTINEYSYVGNTLNDTIELAPDVRASDLTITLENGRDVKITLSDGSTLTILQGAYVSLPERWVECIHFTNGIDADINLVEFIKTGTLYGTNADYEYLYAVDGPGMTIYGLGGEDVIYGAKGNDTLYGDEGNDKLYGYNGNDMLFGGSGNDSLDGGNGNDTLDGGVGNDGMWGAAGDDTYRFGFGQGNDTIGERSGNDTIEMASEVRASDLSFTLENGKDVRIILSDGSSITLGGCAYQPNDSGWVERIHFTNGIDADIDIMALVKTLPMNGTANDEYLYAFDGADMTIHGLGGNDTIYGKNGNDTLYGDEGNDKLYGAAGNDILYGGTGNDNLDGSDGNDTLDGGAGNEYLTGGKGDDTYVFGLGYGHDTVYDTGNSFYNQYDDNTLVIKDVDYDSLWFTKEGDNLNISILGTQDVVTIQHWFYSVDKYQIQNIQTGGHTLNNTMVEQLVQAMSGFNPPAGSIANDENLSAALNETLNHTWHARTAA